MINMIFVVLLSFPPARHRSRSGEAGGDGRTKPNAAKGGKRKLQGQTKSGYCGRQWTRSTPDLPIPHSGIFTP